MGKYDIPAALAYILNATGASTLTFIGHSMGTTMFYVAMNEHQAWMEQHVNLMISLAPVAILSHVKGPIRLISPLTAQVEVW